MHAGLKYRNPDIRGRILFIGDPAASAENLSAVLCGNRSFRFLIPDMNRIIS